MAVEAPVAPAAPSAPAAPAAPATPEIHVTTAAVVADKGPSQPPPKPGSARDRMFQDLRKKAGAAEETTPPAATETKPKGKDDTAPAPAVPGDTKPAETDATKPADTKGAGKEKVSPWKLVDEHKAARAKAEAEIAELRKGMVAPEKLKEIEERAAKAEARAKELDDHIKYVDFSKSTEFAEKYQKPYEAAWNKWMNDLGELTVPDPSTGQERPISAADIATLVNMPLKEARDRAREVFGDFADDVMDARKEIKSLWDSQYQALEDAKKNAGARLEAQKKQAMERAEAAGKEIHELWEAANQSVISDEKLAPFFKPVEGDEEGNKRLAHGYEMADRAFSVSPTNPNLTPEQRAEVVRLHSAVRNRSAAFGRLAYQKSQLEAQVKALNEELAKYKNAEPGAGAVRPEAPAVGTASTKDSVFAALRKIAH